MDCDWKRQKNGVIRIKAMNNGIEYSFIDLPFKNFTSQATLTKLNNFCLENNISLFSFRDKIEFFADHIIKDIEQPTPVNDLIDGLEDATPMKKGIGLIGDTLYYGFKNTPKTKHEEPFDFVIDSKGNFYLDDDFESQFRVVTRFPFYRDVLNRTMSMGAIRNFLRGMGQQNEIDMTCANNLAEMMSTGLDYFNKTIDVLKHYIYIRDEEVYHIIASYIFLTYIYVYFSAVPRLFLNAEYGSGKTKTMDLIGMLCFNPMVASDPSASSLFRTIESTGATILIDDFDKIDAEMKNALDRIWRVGYKKGQKVARTNKETLEPEAFDIYGCSIMNNIESVNEVSLSRSLKINLERAIDQPQVNVELKDNDCDLLKLRDDIQTLCLLNAENFHQFLSTFEPTENKVLKARNRELALPIEAIMRFYGDELTDDVVAYMTNMLDTQMDSFSIDSFLAVMFRFIWKRVNESYEQPTWISVSDIAMFMLTEEHGVGILDERTPEEKAENKRRLASMLSIVGRKLQIYPIIKKRKGSTLYYAFIKDNLKEFLISYKYAEFIGIEEFEDKKEDAPEEPNRFISDTVNMSSEDVKIIKPHNVCFSREDYLDKAKKAIKGDIILFDERNEPVEDSKTTDTVVKSKGLTRERFDELAEESRKPPCQDCGKGDAIEYISSKGESRFMCEKCFTFLKKQGYDGIKKSSLRPTR